MKSLLIKLTHLSAVCAILSLSMAILPANAQSHARIGQAAVPFSLTGSDGKPHSLSDYAGKFIVLEWTNPECPFVRKFYDNGSMQKLQKQYVDKGVVWLRVDSSAPGHPGCLSVSEMADYEKQNQVAATATLLDTKGEVGHEYGATNTPQMFVINPKGDLIYAGGIDDHPSADPSDIPNSKNYVAAALDEAMAGKPVSVAKARPYGCSVKYAR